MKVLKFWIEKFKFMSYFAWHREWMLVKEEWKVTYSQMQSTQADSYRLYRESCARILKILE
jgi:hypothetical protein